MKKTYLILLGMALLLLVFGLILFAATKREKSEIKNEPVQQNISVSQESPDQQAIKKLADDFYKAYYSMFDRLKEAGVGEGEVDLSGEIKEKLNPYVAADFYEMSQGAPYNCKSGWRKSSVKGYDEPVFMSENGASMKINFSSDDNPLETWSSEVFFVRDNGQWKVHHIACEKIF